MVEFLSGRYTVRNGILKIEWRDDSGTHIKESDLPPYFFVHTKDEYVVKYKAQKIGVKANILKTNLKDLDGNACSKVELNYPWEVRNLRDILGVWTGEADIQYIRRYMLDKKVKCATKYEHVLYVDIECDDSKHFPRPEKDMILSIACIDERNNQYWLYNQTRDENGEKEMLKEFWELVEKHNTSMMVAWNGFTFDFPFIENRTQKYFGEFLDYNPVGLYRSFDAMKFYQFYKNAQKLDLESVALDELGKTKIQRNVRVHALSIDELKEYNLNDCVLLKEITEKTKLIDFAVRTARETYLFPDDILGIHHSGGTTPSPIIDALLLEAYRNYGYVAPSKTVVHDSKSFRGAIVLDSLTGVFSNVLQLDFESLYPNTIVAWNLSLEKEKTVIPSLVKHFLELKRNSKPGTPDYWAYKVIVNAIYGVFASKYFRFHNPEYSAEVVSKARDFFMSAVDIISNKLGYKIVAGDTDSCFVFLDDLLTGDKSTDEKLMLNFQKTVNQELYNYWKDKVPNPEFPLRLMIEALWQKILIPQKAGDDKASKKRYAGYVIYKKGKGWIEPKFEITGLEAIRTDWCVLAGNVQQRIIEMKLNGKSSDEVLKEVLQIEQDMRNRKYDKDLILRKGVNKDINDYKVKTQIVKAIENLDTVSREKVLYDGFVYYFVVKPNQVKIVFSPNEIPDDLDYDYYWQKQIRPIVIRLAPELEEKLPTIKVKKIKENKKVEANSESTLDSYF